MKPGQLPKPTRCPVCHRPLEEQVQVIQMLRRSPRDRWEYTGPGRTRSVLKQGRMRKVKRPIYVCTTCSLRVVLHRHRKRGVES